MFESTLGAQALSDGQRKLGAVSVAVLAHAGIVAAIVTATALVVPQFKGPDLPPDDLPIVVGPSLVEPPKRPDPLPPPQKGDRPHRPETSALPPPPVEDVQPTETPSELPTTESFDAIEGPDTPGEGDGGDPNGTRDGIDGGTSTGGSGTGNGHDAGPLELTGEMTRPVRLVRVEPVYPEIARKARLDGRVTLRAVIAEDGRVESVEVLASTNALFNQAAVDAVRKWRYSPAVMSGRPVRVYFSVVVDFLVR